MYQGKLLAFDVGSVTQQHLKWRLAGASGPDQFLDTTNTLSHRVASIEITNSPMAFRAQNGVEACPDCSDCRPPNMSFPSLLSSLYSFPALPPFTAPLKMRSVSVLALHSSVSLTPALPVVSSQLRASDLL